MTLKQKIREAILASLEPLKTSHGIREISRHRDLLATTTLLPALIYIDTAETEVARDAIGQTYEFDFYIKVLADKIASENKRKDELVGAVQAALEILPNFASLGSIINGGEEKTALTARFVFIEGPFVKFRIQYKRKRAEPQNAY